MMALAIGSLLVLSNVANVHLLRRMRRAEYVVNQLEIIPPRQIWYVTLGHIKSTKFDASWEGAKTRFIVTDGTVDWIYRSASEADEAAAVAEANRLNGHVFPHTPYPQKRDVVDRLKQVRAKEQQEALLLESAMAEFDREIESARGES